jgi:hypothetical protein
VKFDGPGRESAYKNDAALVLARRAEIRKDTLPAKLCRAPSLIRAAEELRRGNKNINHGLHTQWQQVNSLSGGDE